MKKLNLENLNLSGSEFLSREQMKNVFGGADALECLPVGSACTGNVQCCSNRCVSGSGGTTGAECGNAG